jgi:hypothetical protein
MSRECAQLYLAKTRNPPPPPFWDSYTRALLLVSKDRRHLFVAPWVLPTEKGGGVEDLGDQYFLALNVWPDLSTEPTEVPA